MSTKIRLNRMGTKGKPNYRLVVQDKRVKRSGNTIEILGSKEKIDKDRVKWWLEHGAEISEAAEKFIRKP